MNVQMQVMAGLFIRLIGYPCHFRNGWDTPFGFIGARDLHRLCKRVCQ